MKSIETLTTQAAIVTLEEALHEACREIVLRVGTPEKPGGTYTRWAAAEPTNFVKERAYEAQTARLIAVSHVLTVMTEKEWTKLLERYAEHIRQLNAQQSLF